MNLFLRWSDFLDGLSRLSTQQRWLRVVAPLGAGVVLLFERTAGGTVQSWFVAVALALAALVAALPDSSACLFLMLLLGGHWALFVPESTSGWVLAAALVLLAVHVATNLASYGPPCLVLPGRLLEQWGRRVLLVAAGTGLVWMAVRFWPAGPASVAGWATGAALVVVLAWLAGLAGALGPHR